MDIEDNMTVTGSPHIKARSPPHASAALLTEEREIRESVRKKRICLYTLEFLNRLVWAYD